MKYLLAFLLVSCTPTQTNSSEPKMVTANTVISHRSLGNVVRIIDRELRVVCYATAIGGIDCLSSPNAASSTFYE